MKNVLILAITSLFFVSGCSTATYVKLPKDTVVKIKRGSGDTHGEGKIVRSPLSWSSAGGIPFQLEKNGTVVKEGKMRARFRPASIFWPPFALLYWPMGFGTQCNDLTVEYPHTCSPEVLREMQTASP